MQRTYLCGGRGGQEVSSVDHKQSVGKVWKSQAVTNWDRNPVPDYHLVSDLAAGTIDVDANDTGVYSIAISGFCSLPNNSESLLTIYADGVPTLIRAPVVTKNVNEAPIGWAGIANISIGAQIDLRNETGGATMTIYSLNWSMHRISPAAGTS